MKIAAQILKPCQIDVDVEGITLLSTEEAEKLPLFIRLCMFEGQPEWWWLRSPGCTQYRASRIRADGSISFLGSVDCSDSCVRPALKISNLESLNMPLYASISLFDRDWIVISHDMILSQKAIGSTAFRADRDAPDANDYEKSDIKEYMENWLKKQLENSK